MEKQELEELSKDELILKSKEVGCFSEETNISSMSKDLLIESIINRVSLKNSVVDIKSNNDFYLDRLVSNDKFKSEIQDKLREEVVKRRKATLELRSFKLLIKSKASSLVELLK